MSTISELGGHRIKTPRSLFALTLVNLAILLFLLAQQFRPAFAQVSLRSAWSLAGNRRQPRPASALSINVFPSEKAPTGDDQPETVLLRLITERGRPSVKIGSSEPTSGLSFAGPTGTKDTYVVLQSTATVSSLKLRNENGREQVLSP
jgi:hypothetical protein